MSDYEGGFDITNESIFEGSGIKIGMGNFDVSADSIMTAEGIGTCPPRKALYSAYFLPANETLTAGETKSITTSRAFIIESNKRITITLHAKGAAGATGTVTFSFATKSLNDLTDAWDTQGYKELSVNLSGTNDVYATYEVEPNKASMIKLASIKNGDAGNATCNAIFSVIDKVYRIL